MTVDLGKVREFAEQEIDWDYPSPHSHLLEAALEHLKALVAEVEGLRKEVAQLKGQPTRPSTSFQEVFKKIREAGGDAWDEIDDPEAFIREMRGE